MKNEDMYFDEVIGSNEELKFTKAEHESIRDYRRKLYEERLNKMKAGSKALVTSNYSISGKQEEVTILSIEGDSCKVKYSWGYIETLPFSVLN